MADKIEIHNGIDIVYLDNSNEVGRSKLIGYMAHYPNRLIEFSDEFVLPIAMITHIKNHDHENCDHYLVTITNILPGED